MKRFFLSCVFFNLIISYPVMGQVVKKDLTQEDYKLWSTMRVQKLSESGKWVSYSLSYESGKDTLCIRNTKTAKAYAIPGGYNGSFSAEKHFACSDTNGNLILIRLKDGKKEMIPAVSSFVVSENGRSIMVLKKSGNNRQDLLIRDLETKKDIVLPDVTTFSYHPDSNALVCDSERKLKLFYLSALTGEGILIDESKDSYSDLTWQRNGQSVAYFAGDSIRTLGYYRLKDSRRYTFDTRHYNDFPKDAKLYNSSSSALTIADDGQRIIFGVKQKIVDSNTGGVQLWNAADKMIYPYQHGINNGNTIPKLAVWTPTEDRFMMITDNQFSKAMVTADFQSALVYDPTANEPQWDQFAPKDIYIKSLRDGSSKLILKHHDGDNKICLSDGGRYVVYYKVGDWWSYDILEAKEYNLTANIGVTFEDENYDKPGKKPVNDVAGWTENDAEVLIYDTYDIWLMKPDGTGASRLTNGRPDKIKFRIISPPPSYYSGITPLWITKQKLNLEDGLLLSVSSDEASGLYRWNPTRGISKIALTPNCIQNVMQSKNKEVITFTEEHFHQSPVLKAVFKDNKPTVMFRSNQHQQRYNWGFSRIFSYTNSKGQRIKAGLLYPANYDPGKRYPMVVHIYQRMISHYNRYENPTLLNRMGLNYTNLILDGYFVLLPDILYEEGNAGASAVDCVVSACKEVIANESVDPKRLGLIGHSFGGYETNFIITQTDMFAAAVSGAGVSDFTSGYLYVDWNSSKPKLWRFEADQYRLGNSLFENREAYNRNSPINFVENITTSLLLWTGEEDLQVNASQSLELHLALRRLQKPNILLIYEGDSHSISNQNHQVDLTQRVEAWFNFYLKDGKQQDWMFPDRLK